MDNPDFILTVLITLVYAMLGLCMGSFASAIAHRIRIGQSWIIDKRGEDAKPARSCCPSCGHILSTFDLIPFFSWIFLGGKCRYCKVSIPIRYPLIELTGAVAMILFAMSVISKWALLVFVITLPFALVFILLLSQKIKPPIYIGALFFLNIFVWISNVLYGGGA